jgi:prepilin-type N-terminal cleavage/methylation domain-containing protein
MTPTSINRKNGFRSTQKGEAGFTMMELVIVLVLASILGIFVLQIATSSLNTFITMRKRKERADDAVLALERMSREIRAANAIDGTGSNILTFQRADTDQMVRFIRNTSTNRLRRQSAADVASLPGNSSSGDIVAENVLTFQSYWIYNTSNKKRIGISLELSDGSDWDTKISPRSYGL